MSLNDPKRAEMETVLVVDDEILIRIAICDYLRECGYRVIGAATTDEAMVVLQQGDSGIDVVLADAEVSGAVDGFALAQWIRANKPNVSVILAGTPARAAAAAGELCDSGPMLSRPYEPAMVLDRIKRLLAESATRKENDKR
jgi:DNA-binding response OmpR family regulator